MYEEKRKKTNIFEICTCQQINKAKNTADKQLTSIVAAVDNICKKRQQKKKTLTFTVSWQKQIKLYVSSQKG